MLWRKGFTLNLKSKIVTNGPKHKIMAGRSYGGPLPPLGQIPRGLSIVSAQTHKVAARASVGPGFGTA